MDNTKTFTDFLENIKVQGRDKISKRYKRITKALNKKFYDTEDEIKHSLQIGSYGRKTAIKDVSDLDMIFEISEDDFKKYNNRAHNGQSDLLQDVKNAICASYSSTSIRGDRQVVVVEFTDYMIEVCPAYLLEDSSYKYPDAKDGGSWKITKPRQEINELKDFNSDCNDNVRRLARMVRAWKNKNGVEMGGLLIDTFAYDFFKENDDLQKSDIANFDNVLLKFFEYLKSRNEHQKYWYAPGSRQKVYKKKNFIKKAKKAFENIQEAIENSDKDNVYGIWRKVFGNVFPYPQTVLESSTNYTRFEQFIEDLHPVDIRNSLKIDCLISQKGFREMLLSQIPFIKSTKKLKFYIKSTDVVEPYEVKWKVKNKGEIAKKRNMLRGQIHDDNGSHTRNENSNFSGEHYVECYIIKKGICVARDRITVPISIA